MAEKTEKKVNKLAIAVITLFVALIAAIGGIFGVYAALQQNISTTFSVQYSIGKNVAVAIGAKTINSANMSNITWFEADTTLTKNSNNLYEIGINNDNQNLNLHLPAANNNILKVESDQNQFLFYFVQNLSDKDLKIKVTDNCEVNGFAVNYIHGTVSDTSSIAPPDPTQLDENNQISYTLSANEIYCLMIIIYRGENFDVNRDASYTSTAEKGISFVFEQA